MKPTITTTVVISFTIIGCNNKVPSREDVIGKWVSVDGAATISISKDSTFSATNIPSAHLASYIKAEYGNIFNDEGHWELLKNSSRWEVKLIVNQMSFPIYIAQDGIIESGDKWHLFLWKNEDVDGDRYEFKKQ